MKRLFIYLQIFALTWTQLAWADLLDQFRAKEARLRTIVGDEIVNDILAEWEELNIEDQQKLAGCRVSNSRPTFDPEAGGGIELEDLVAPRFREVYSNWREYSPEDRAQATTDRHANHAIKNFSRDSLRQDSNFLLAAYRFYKVVLLYDQMSPFPAPSSRYMRDRYDSPTQLSLDCNDDGDPDVIPPLLGTAAGPNFGLSPIDVNASFNQNKLRQAMQAVGLRVDNLPDRITFYDVALRCAGGDAYQAMKIIQVYGHDNMENVLYESGGENDCRFALLDSVMPIPPSRFYQNGAIGAQWSTQRREQGEAVAHNCTTSAACLRRRLSARSGQGAGRSWVGRLYQLCSDAKSTYQGDYYHVLAGAYAGCRGDIAGRQAETLANPLTPLLSGLPSAVTSLVDWGTQIGYSAAVRAYKAKRFWEEIECPGGLTNSSGACEQQDTLSSDDKNILKTALVAVTGGADVTTALGLALGSSFDFGEALGGSSDVKVQMFRSIVERWKFELDFRQEQHRIGERRAREACAGQTTIDAESLATAVTGAVDQQARFRQQPPADMTFTEEEVHGADDT